MTDCGSSLIDENCCLTQGQGVVRVGAAIHRFRQAKITELPRSASSLTYVSSSWPLRSIDSARCIFRKEWTEDPDRSGSQNCACRPQGFAGPNKSLRREMIATRRSPRLVPFKWGLTGDLPSNGVGKHRAAHYVGRGKGYVLGSGSAMCPIWGKRPPVAGNGWQISPDGGAYPTGASVGQGEPEPKGPAACTIGVISNWPISKPSSSNSSANDGFWGTRVY